jgi:transposase
MAIVTLRLTDVNSKIEERPLGCPHCGSMILQGWGKVSKQVRDTQLVQVEVQRYRCTSCGRTFRYYPKGVSKADQSLRLQQLAAIMWTLGLSCRGVTGLLGAFAIRLCHMSAWRDVQQLAEARRRGAVKRRVKVLGVDGVYGKIRGKGQGAMIAVDMGTGTLVALAQVDEHDGDAVKEWLGPLVEKLGVEVVVTDDLGVYGAVTEALGVGHQVCEFHLLRWVSRALRGLQKELGEGYREPVEEVWRIVSEMPADGRWRLQMIWEGIRPQWRKREGPAEAVHRFRMLVLRLAESWDRYTL